MDIGWLYFCAIMDISNLDDYYVNIYIYRYMDISINIILIRLIMFMIDRLYNIILIRLIIYMVGFMFYYFYGY